jgi:flagellin-like protein
MELRQLLTDERAVPPVIGVILMVAITVILAAVIAAFVLGLGDTNDVAPNTSFEYDYDEGAGELNVRVRSGDTFDSDRISFEGENLGTGVEGSTWTDYVGSTTDVSSGADVTLGDGTLGSGGTVASNFLLELTWTSEEGGTSSVISTREGPDR